MKGKHLGDFFTNRQEPGRAGLPVLSVTMNDSLVFRDDLDRRLESMLRPDQHLLVRPGDIAYNMMRMWQGACGLATAEGMVSPAYVVLAPKATMEPRFAYHWFKSDRMVYLFWAYSHGLTEDRLRLYFDAFAEIPATAPDLEVQRKIATVLDAWDDAILQTKRIIAAKRQRATGLMARMVFTRNQSIGRDDLQQIRLKDLGTLIRGVTYNPVSDVLAAPSHDAVSVLTAANVQKGEVRLFGDETIVTAAKVRADQMICKGDFVLSMSNGSKNLVGKAGLADETLTFPCAPGAFCAIFRPKNEECGMMASILFQSEGYREQLHIALAGSSINNLTNSELEDFTFNISTLLPSTDPSFFRAVGNDLRKAEISLSKLCIQKRTLMRELFSSEWNAKGQATNLGSSKEQNTTGVSA